MSKQFNLYFNFLNLKIKQKLMSDEKRAYFFGRNKDQCEFVIEHASCSRCHAVLLWHKHLNRSFLIDLNSGDLKLDLSFLIYSFIFILKIFFVWY